MLTEFFKEDGVVDSVETLTEVYKAENGDLTPVGSCQDAVGHRNERSFS